MIETRTSRLEKKNVTEELMKLEKGNHMFINERLASASSARLRARPTPISSARPNSQIVCLFYWLNGFDMGYIL
jgi:hypothetical protein